MEKILKTSSKNEPTRPPKKTCLSMGTGSAINFKITSRPRPNHFAFILKTCFNQLPIHFRHTATIFRGVSQSFLTSFYLSQASVSEEGPKALERIKQGPTRSKACKGDSLAARFACGSLALRTGKGTLDRFPAVLQTSVIDVSSNFRSIATLLKFVSYRSQASVYLIGFFSSHCK